MKLRTDRLVECREQLGMTKQDVSFLLGQTQPSYLRYESGIRHPSLQVAKEIARVLDTSVEYLTGESDDPQPNAYEVSRENDEVLFLIVENARSLEQTKKRHLLAYAEKLSKPSSRAKKNADS